MKIEHYLVYFTVVIFSPMTFCASIPDVFNSEKVEYGGIQTPVGMFVSRSEGPWGGSTGSQIHMFNDTAGQFQLAPFASKQYDESDPYYDPVKKRVCFISNRPINTNSQVNANGDIWCTSKSQQGWQKPYRLPEPVNSQASEYSPVFDNSGTLFFASDRQGGFGQGDIYSAQQKEGTVWQVTNLGSAINTKYGEWNLGLNPDGDQMIIESSSRPENISVPGDLYFSRRLSNNTWSNAIPLSTLNSNTSDLMPRWFAPDKLVFTTGVSGNMDHKAINHGDWQPLPPSVAVVSRSKGEVILLDPQTLKESARLPLGTGPHEIATSLDGRISVSPLFGIFPTPHEKPVEKRPPFLVKPSNGLALIDLANGKRQIIGLDDCPRPHGADADAQARRIWVTCEQSGQIIEFSRHQNQISQRYRLDKGIHKVLYLAATQILLGTNPDNGKVYKITLQDSQVSSLFTGAGAEGLVANPQGTAAWITNSGARSVCRLDVIEMTVDWCHEEVGAMPIAVTYSTSDNGLWVSLFGQRAIALLDATSGEKVALFSLPHSALDLEYNPDEAVIYASIPRLNALLAIDVNSRKIVHRFDGVMEADDVDYIATTLSR